MKISIITINYNNLEGLKRTYESVVSQTCQDFEWIIIDGGSTDGSKEFIEEHQDKFDYWCSEPDKGVYNAMNKGIVKSNGEYLNFLNSGDCFCDENIIEEFILSDFSEDIILGDIILDGDIKRVRRHPDDKNMDFDYLYYDVICHQASFIKRYLFSRYGMYDESYKIVADWKFFVEMFLIHNCSYRHWNRVVVCYYTDGLSSDKKNLQLCIDERTMVMKKYTRFIHSIKKRDKRIQELDLPVITIIRQRIKNKLKIFL